MLHGAPDDFLNAVQADHLARNNSQMTPKGSGKNSKRKLPAGKEKDPGFYPGSSSPEEYRHGYPPDLETSFDRPTAAQSPGIDIPKIVNNALCPANKGQPASPETTEGPAAPPRKVTGAEMNALIQDAERGNPQSAAIVESLLLENPDSVKQVTELNTMTRSCWIDNLMPEHQTFNQLNKEYLKQLSELIAQEPDFESLKKMLAGQITLSHLQLSSLDTVIAPKLNGDTKELLAAITVSNKAHSRLMKSIRTFMELCSVGEQIKAKPPAQAEDAA
jgi:hypothetical protein